MPEEGLEKAGPPEKTAVMEYLKRGGLVAILRGNLGGGPKEPKAWLTYTPSGAITHTFAADRGVIGGAAIPFFALHEYKIFTGKKEQVLAFLESFGLNRAEAADVLAAVGTAP
jgi:hypothetical protein